MPKLKRSAKNYGGEPLICKESSGNVFVDLGFSEHEAANLVLRCELMDAVEKLIKKNGWTQGTAARKLDVHQPRISDLFQGHIDLFSTDTLIEWLDKLGKKVHFTVKDKAAA